VRPFKPATEPRDLNPTDKTRANHIVDRVLRLDPESAAQQLSDVLENFEGRHRNLLNIFEARAAEMEEALEPHASLNTTQRRLIGAYFLHEYSFEASALFNPSIVRHPDQSGAQKNGCRFILSLRAVGEPCIQYLCLATVQVLDFGFLGKTAEYFNRIDNFRLLLAFSQFIEIKWHFVSTGDCQRAVKQPDWL